MDPSQQNIANMFSTPGTPASAPGALDGGGGMDFRQQILNMVQQQMGGGQPGMPSATGVPTMDQNPANPQMPGMPGQPNQPQPQQEILTPPTDQAKQFAQFLFMEVCKGNTMFSGQMGQFDKSQVVVLASKCIRAAVTFTETVELYENAANDQQKMMAVYKKAQEDLEKEKEGKAAPQTEQPTQPQQQAPVVPPQPTPPPAQPSQERSTSAFTNPPQPQ